jgi:hypothetical protein
MTNVKLPAHRAGLAGHVPVKVQSPNVEREVKAEVEVKISKKI